MKRLWVRFSLSFGVLILIIITLLALLPPVFIRSGMYASSKREMRPWVAGSYTRLSNELARYYVQNGSWDGVGPLIAGARAVMAREDARIVLADRSGNVIFDAAAQRDDAPLDSDEASRAVEVRVDDKVVALVVNRDPALPSAQSTPEGDRAAVRPPPPPDAPSRGDFLLEQLLRYMLIAAVVGAPGALLAGALVSRGLTRPLSRLADAAREIGRGNLSRRVDPTGSAELVEVAESFNEMVDALQRSEALRRSMITDVAHELRTPVTVLQGNLRAILDDVYPMDKDEIAGIYDQTLYLSRLIGDLHELTLAEAGQLPLQRQALDLGELVQGAVGAFTPLTEARGLRLDTDIPPGLPAVNGDAARLTQVLYNLLSNALRHTKTGFIRVSARCEQDAADGLPPIRLTVTDSGDGIPPAHVKDVFERFYRLDGDRSREGGGSGLGLAIVRAIVESHGGRVTATSEGVPGRGSAFTVYLPAEGQ